MTLRQRLAASVGAMLFFALLVPANTARASDDNGSLLSAEAEAYAYRVEYDLPIPAGSGTVAHVTATAQRSQSVETSHGLAAAPTQFDAVVGGRYTDPQQTGHPINKLPQVECNFPSSEPTHLFRWPTDSQAATSNVPATAYSYASCGAGPSVELRSRVADPSSGADQTSPPPADLVGAHVSDASIRPDHGKLVASASSSASNLAFGGGVLRIGSVRAVGSSATKGTAGTASSNADIVVSDISAGATTFSLAFTGTGVVLTAGGTAMAIDAAPAQAVMASVNSILAGRGCSITVVRDPAHYPQGFLFSRPQPDLGVREDGSLAASYRGGLLVVCDVPDNPVAQSTKFSPERFQALVGFVYTSVAAKADIGGFGIPDLSGGSGSLGLAPSALAVPADVGVPAGVGAPTLAAAAQSPSAPVVANPPRDLPTMLTSFLPPLSAGERWALGLACLALWAWLTHLGVTRLLAVGGGAIEGHDQS